MVRFTFAARWLIFRPMQQRTLGKNGPRVSALGLGCMGMSEFYGPRDEAESLATIHHALDRGVTLLDTADMYGSGQNEELLAKVLQTRRADAFVATKFGFVRDPANPQARVICGRPDYVRAGKVRHLGLSEPSADSLCRAHAVHPIAAVQSEYSLWTRDPEVNGSLAACRELGVGFVPYSPLGRGFLTGQIRRFEDLAADDQRRTQPRFQGDNFSKNLEIVARLNELAARKGCTAAQLALAWVLAQGGDIVPIPGTRRRHNLDENLAALAVVLTPAERDTISSIFPPGAAAGERYPERMMSLVGR